MEDRDKLIREKIAEKESIEMMQLMGAKHIVYEILTKEKGFYPEEIQIDPQFILPLSTCDATVGIDFMITLEGISFMIIRCVSSGIESWERYVVAFARAVKNYQIPYAVITDGEQAKVLDIINDSFEYKSVQELFTRRKAMTLIKNFSKIPCPDIRQEKEKRIIYAFEGIKCRPAKQDIS
jgi:Type I restriction enzyme R protein N terminus (HSDR_N)